MKRIAIGTLFALLALPAAAGPILDRILPDTAKWTGSEADIDNLETYAELTIVDGETSIYISSLQLIETDVITFEARGVIVESGSNTIGAEAVSLSGVQDVFAGLDVLTAILKKDDVAPMTPADCVKADTPIDLIAKNVKISDSTTIASIDVLAVSYDIVSPQADCISDITIKAGNMSVSDNSGLSISLDGAELDIFFTLFSDRAPVDTDSLFTSSLSLDGLRIDADGVEQVRVSRIASSGSLASAGLPSLYSAGYAGLVQAFSLFRINGQAPDMTGVSTPAIWNAAIKLDAAAALEAYDVVMTGDMAQTISGSDMLAQGSRLDLSGNVLKSGSEVAFVFDLRGSKIADISLNINLDLLEVDEAFDGGNRALAMTAPFALTQATVILRDNGAGEHVSEMAGADVYKLSGVAASAFVGGQSADILVEWLSGARTQEGAYLSVRPDTPMPAVQLFISFLGSWTDLGSQLNVSTIKPAISKF